jgi:hypothetical protein
MPTPTYVLGNHDLVLDNANKRYILRVRDHLSDSRPLERLIKEGARALPVADLLAVVLTTGTDKEGVLEMSSRILKDYGQKSLLSQIDVGVLATDLEIPLAKAAQIIAMNELGRRYHQRNPVGLPVIRTAEHVFGYVTDMRTLPKEHLRGLYRVQLFRSCISPNIHRYLNWFPKDDILHATGSSASDSLEHPHGLSPRVLWRVP